MMILHAVVGVTFVIFFCSYFVGAVGSLIVKYFDAANAPFFLQNSGICGWCRNKAEENSE